MSTFSDPANRLIRSPMKWYYINFQNEWKSCQAFRSALQNTVLCSVVLFVQKNSGQVKMGLKKGARGNVNSLKISEKVKHIGALQ